MIIRTISVTPFSQNARVIIDSSSVSSPAEAMVVDPGGDIPLIMACIRSYGSPLQVKKIFLTHAHIDHAGGVLPLCDLLETSTGLRPIVLAHPGEKELRASVSKQALLFGLSPADYHNAPEPDVEIQDGDLVSIGGVTGTALFTPGHSPGHLALLFAVQPGVEIELQEMAPRGDKVASSVKLQSAAVIAGDTLFQSSIGRTDLPGGDHETLLRSIRTKLFSLPDATFVLPGHGPNTTIGQEKRTNPFFVSDRSHFA